MSSAPLLLSRFEPVLDTVFDATPLSEPGAPAVPLTLREVTDIRPEWQREQEADDADTGQFTLLFKGPATPLLSQGTFLMEHPDLGPVHLFLVPVGQESGHTFYEAVVNSPLDPTLFSLDR